MILAVDVHYHNDSARIAGIAIDGWENEVPIGEYISEMSGVADYRPGMFFLRELPCIIRLIAEHCLAPEIIIVDGYVYLDGAGKPGLGKHLFDALRGKVAVIGVAKRAFKGISREFAVYRGSSKSPLYVTSEGIELFLAKAVIAKMQGKYRLPDLLKQVDQLCRGLTE